MGSSREENPDMDDPSSYDSGDFIAEFYDHVAPYRDRPDIAFYVEIAKVTAGTVLELGCGTGRVLLPTAMSDVDIVGLDSSSAMLRACEERLRKLPENVRKRVRLIEGDMRSFALGESFDLITIPFRPFQHLLRVEDQIRALECVHRHLADRGRLVFDVFYPSLSALVADNLGEEICEEPEFVAPNGERVVRRHRILSRNLIDQTNDVELIYYVTLPDGRTERYVHSFSMRYFFRFELEHLLDRCGFELMTVYGDFNRSPLSPDHCAEMICVARRSPTSPR